MDNHRHSFDLDEHGHFKVNKQKGEPDIVFDGLCHDEHERLTEDPDRKVLPVPNHVHPTKPDSKGPKPA